jgi:hypothetical protein
MDQLIVERKFEKAKNYWFGADKMPLDKFGYYSLVEPLQKDTTKWVKSESTSTLREIDGQI